MFPFISQRFIFVAFIADLCRLNHAIKNEFSYYVYVFTVHKASHTETILTEALKRAANILLGRVHVC